MQKVLQPSIQEELVHECNICSTNDEEIHILLNNLINLMKKRKQNKNRELRNMSESLYAQKYEGSLQKLLKFMFAQKILDQRAEACKHEVLQEFIQMKTKLSRRQIDIQSQLIYQFQAKRNFELQVLNSQIKCFTKTILDEILTQNQRIPSIQNLTEANNRMMIKKEPTSTQNLINPPQMMSQQDFQGYFYVLPMNQMNLQHVFYSQNFLNQN